jgi:molybdopterin synthase catalytic subunit
MKIVVQEADFDVGSELESLATGDTRVGAVASFIGRVRATDDNCAIGAMTLEHYPAMTQKALEQIVEEARIRWDVRDASVIHRVGRLLPGDQIVFVAVASGHRGDAFAACEFIMDFLKTRAPFWKREETPEGERWVEAKESDDAAADRWTRA